MSVCPRHSSSRLYSSEVPDPTEKADKVDPALLKWQEPLADQNPSDFDMLFALRKQVEDSNARKAAEWNARAKVMPALKAFRMMGQLVKEDVNKIEGSVPVKKGANLAPCDSNLDQVLGADKWEEITPQMETTASRLVDLRDGDTAVILGAGISGLSLAWFLANARPDIKIKIVEKKDRVGGYMNSVKTNSNTGEQVLFELGPRTLLPGQPGTSVIVGMAKQLNILSELRAVSSKSPTNTKGLIFNDRLVQLPQTLFEAIQFAFSPLLNGIRFAALKELYVKARPKTVHDETLESFITRRFNKRLSDRLISPVIRGIYAGDVSQLSARSTARFNRLYSLERTQGISVVGAVFSGILSSLSSYARLALPVLAQSMTTTQFNSDYMEIEQGRSLLLFKDGVETLPRALEADLKQRFAGNVEFIRGAQVQDIALSAGGCRVTTSSPHANKIDSSIVISTLAGKDIAQSLNAPGAESAKKLASSIKYSTVGVVNFYFPEIQKSKDWFGFLVPKTEDDISDDILGVIFDSAVRKAAKPVTPGVAPDPSPPGTILTVMMGGHLWENQPLPTEEEIKQRCIKFLAKHLGPEFSTTKFTSRLTIQKNSIPQYTVGHSETVQKVQNDISEVYNNRLFLSGTSFGRGVGISDAVVDSLTIASRYAATRKAIDSRFYVNNLLTLSNPDIYA